MKAKMVYEKLRKRIFITNLDQKWLTDSQLKHPQNQVSLLPHHAGVSWSYCVSRMGPKVKRIWTADGLLTAS
jgi:hypothetical protein